MRKSYRSASIAIGIAASLLVAGVHPALAALKPLPITYINYNVRIVRIGENAARKAGRTALHEIVLLDMNNRPRRTAGGAFESDSPNTLAATFKVDTSAYESKVREKLTADGYSDITFELKAVVRWTVPGGVNYPRPGTISVQVLFPIVVMANKGGTTYKNFATAGSVGFDLYDENLKTADLADSVAGAESDAIFNRYRAK